MKSISKKQNNSIKTINKFQRYLSKRKIVVEELKSKPRSSINTPKLLNSIVSAVHIDNKTYSKVDGVKTLISIDKDSKGYLQEKKQVAEEVDYSLVLNQGKITELGLRLALSIIRLSYKTKSKELKLTLNKLNKNLIGNSKRSDGGSDNKLLSKQLAKLSSIYFVGTKTSQIGTIASTNTFGFPLFDFSIAKHGKRNSYIIQLSEEIYSSMFEDERFFAVFYDENYLNLKLNSSRILYAYLRTYDKGCDKTCINVSQIFERTDISKGSNYKNKLKKVGQEINSKCKDDILLHLDFKKEVLTINYKDKVGNRK